MQTIQRWLPWLILLVGVTYVVGAAYPRKSKADDFNLVGFGQLPILDHGRIKPVDTYARVELLMITRRQEYYDAQEPPRKQPATRWLLNLLADGIIDTLGTVQISPQEAEWLGLQNDRPVPVYDVREILQAAKGKQEQFKELLTKQNRSPLEEQVFMTVDRSLRAQTKMENLRKELGPLRDADKQKVFRIDHESVLGMLQLKRREGLRYSIDEITHANEEAKRQAFADFFRRAMKAKDIPNEKRDSIDQRTLELFKQLSTHRALASLQAVALVPDVDFTPGGWKTLGQALAMGEDQHNPAAKHLKAMVWAYAENEPEKFNQELAAYTQLVNEKLPTPASKARVEAWFNQFAPFYVCAILYVLIGLLALFSWTPAWPREMWLGALLLLGLTLIVHTAALGLRMWIQERPPVVNLYSSAVFIGWGCALVCLFVELIYRNAISTAAAAVLGFMTMVIAHYLGGSGDTMEVLQAVLDTNFWLATHVTTVTLGYTATFVAGFIAIAFLWWMQVTTVFAFFRNRGKPEWSNGLVFISSVFGMLAIPAAAGVSVVMGLFFLTTDENPLEHNIWLMFVLPAAIVVAILGILLIIRFTGPIDHNENPIPPMLQSLEPFNLNVNLSKAFMTAIYGVTCLALLLSFVGTVLGGIWADQSWGRFWGWDPKENGAILVVIVNALLLHARWGGMIKERGTVIIALLGNMVCMWSWFGTNQLGIGLHSYGFNNALIKMCSSFWGVMLVLIGLASLPNKYWKSYTAHPEAPSKPGKASRGTAMKASTVD
jgi:ABC-type transport system involved in cytochrome c biogenesis permease subunit